MSCTTWATHGHELPEEKIKEIAPEAYSAFVDTVYQHEVTLDEYAKYRHQKDVEELAFGDFNGEDVFVLADKLDKLFDALSKEIASKTNILINLVYPGGEVETGEDRVYWEISNATIFNPSIDKKYLENSYFEVITGG